jgi:lipopolysaccharide biosynthesis glycosyltransferase
MKTVYMGWDSREELAYDVAKFSVERRSKDVEVKPLKLNDIYFLSRPIDVSINANGDIQMYCKISQAPMSTEFAISRFAIPFLQKSGWALFMDCDMVCLEDINHLFNLADPEYAVMVVKHGKLDGEGIKMDGQIQTTYPKKNWSSVILWNLDHPSNKNLTKHMLNTLAGRDLHAFCWLKEEEIGELPGEWNYLVDVNPVIDNPKIAHYTLGGPWIENWMQRHSDKIWNNEYALFK